MDGSGQGAALRDYLRVLRRRKWLIALTVVLVPLTAVIFSLRQSVLYEASAEVLLSRQNLAATLTNTQDPLASQQAERVAQTQADLARTPTVAARVLEAARAPGTPQEFLDASSVRPKSDSDLLIFKVQNGRREEAARLATEYARQFTRYRRELDTVAFKRARQELEARIATLEKNGGRGTPLHDSLVEKEQQLRTLEALQISNAYLIRSATDAEQVRPTPVRNGLLGLALGLVLGIGLAFLREALDTRIRSADEIGERLDLPLVARLPEPPKRVRRDDGLVMLTDPRSPQAEAFRILRTNLEFLNLERGARTIMVTSALETEGKSTTVANLAVACVRAGKRVAVVDLDLRRPYLERFFRLEGAPGLTDVALGHVPLDEALVPVPVGESRTSLGVSWNGRGSVEGIVDVLAAGPIPPDAGEFVGTRAVGEILERLQARYDLVLVDSPPLLHVGDAMTLAASVDALLLVTSLRLARRPALDEVHRILEALPAHPLGFVIAGAELEEGGYGYSYNGYYGRTTRPTPREPVA
jgi:succinoglycan biosynthesis transport protein ExoP